MTVAYSINGGSEIYGVSSSWIRRRRREEIDNQVTYTNMAVNRWRLALMDAATFETLRALQGDALTSIETNGIDARNTATQYTTVTMGLVEGQQVGVNMRNITIEFSIDLTSEV